MSFICLRRQFQNSTINTGRISLIFKQYSLTAFLNMYFIVFIIFWNYQIICIEYKRSILHLHILLLVLLLFKLLFSIKQARKGIFCKNMTKTGQKMLFLLENGSLDQSSIVIHIRELLKETRKKRNCPTIPFILSNIHYAILILSNKHVEWANFR